MELLINQQKREMNIELNFLGVLIKFEHNDQEAQEYSIMWKMGDKCFESPIIAIQPIED